MGVAVHAVAIAGMQGALYAVSAIHGIVAGAVDPLYLGFAFLDSWAGEVEVAARRMALVEPGRHRRRRRHRRIVVAVVVVVIVVVVLSLRWHPACMSNPH